MTDPEVGRLRRLMQRTSVLLPAPASADNAEDIAGFDVDVYILTGKEFSFTVSSIVFLRYVF